MINQLVEENLFELNNFDLEYEAMRYESIHFPIQDLASCTQDFEKPWHIYIAITWRRIFPHPQTFPGERLNAGEYWWMEDT